MFPKRRILVVEDEPTVREPILVFLRHKGYAAEGAENGVEALDCLKRNPYDLVILDIKMPYLDGRALSQILRDECLTVPVLVITAYAEEEPLAQEKGRLLKSFSFEELHAQIRKILSP